MLRLLKESSIGQCKPFTTRRFCPQDCVCRVFASFSDAAKDDPELLSAALEKEQCLAKCHHFLVHASPVCRNDRILML